MKKAILILVTFLFIWLGFNKANAFDILTVQDVYFDYKNYKIANPNQRDLLIYPDKPKEGVNLGIETGLFNEIGYSNLLLETVTDDGQYRGVGLQYSLGVHLSHFIDVGIWHHSQHVLDRGNETIPKFSAEDALEVKIHIYREK